MHKEDKIEHFAEIIVSVGVISVITEIIHYMIAKSGLSTSINQFMFFGYVGSNALAIVVAVAILILLYLFLRNNFVSQFTIVCLFSGGIVNLVDRWRYGGALDYVRISNIPTFNLADVYLTLGIIALVLETISHWQRKS